MKNKKFGKLSYPGVLELAYIGVLEASAARIKGSTPFAWTNF